MGILRYLILSVLLPFQVLSSTTLNVGIKQEIIDANGVELYQWIQQAAKEANINLVIRSIPPKRSLMLAQEGLIDGVSFRHSLIEEMYPALVRVDVQLKQQEYMVAVLKQAECMESFDDLAQLKPVGLRGVKFFDTQVYPYSLVGRVVVMSPAKVVDALQRGLADYTVHPKFVLESESSKQGSLYKSCLDKPYFSLPFYLYLHQSKQHLIPALEKALKEAKR